MHVILSKLMIFVILVILVSDIIYNYNNDISALIMNESPEDTELDVGRLPQKTLINCSTTG